MINKFRMALLCLLFITACCVCNADNWVYKDKNEKDGVIIASANIKEMASRKFFQKETAGASIEQARIFQHFLNFPDRLAAEINKILRDEKIKKEDPDAICYAAHIAGAYRLVQCVPALIDKIDYTLNREKEERFRFRIFTPIKYSIVTDALIKIGKPVIPYILKLASSKECTERKLIAAGKVLSGIEGELAFYVVENYIKKSSDPEQVRKMFERRYFKDAWVQEQAEKDKSKGD